jgi:RNA polymerase sigma-70 factor (ECF subfamily)
MLAADHDYLSSAQEGSLRADESSSAAERFLRLADGELNRAYRLAGLILGDSREAEDATQDALLRAWRAAASLRNPAGFQAWFDRILINACTDRLRRRGMVRTIVLDEAAPLRLARDPFKTTLDRDELLRAMTLLDSDLRIVIVLHYWADLTLEAVAERIGTPVGTVKSRLHRGLSAMKASLTSSGPVATS